MRAVATHSHHHGMELARAHNLLEWSKSLFECPKILWRKGASAAVRTHVREILREDGWAQDLCITPASDLTLMGMKERVAFQLQTGNISRVAYDLLKLQLLYANRRAELAIYALPSAKGARLCGPSSNLAQAERIVSELKIFDRIVTIPILLVAFE